MGHDPRPDEEVAISFSFAPNELYLCLVQLTVRQRLVQLLALLDLLLFVLCAASGSSLTYAVVFFVALVFIVGVAPALTFAPDTLPARSPGLSF